MARKLIPLDMSYGRYQIRRTDQETDEKMGEGLLYRPDATRRRKDEGIVIAGPYSNRMEEPCALPGDVVLLNQFAGPDINLDGEEFLLCKAQDILAIIVEE